MEQHVLKRSWSTYHEDHSPAPILQDFSPAAFPPIDVNALSPQQRHILAEAASILKVSVQTLLRFHHYSNVNYILRIAAATLQVTPEDLVRLTESSRSPKRRRLGSAQPPSGPSSHCVAQNSMEKSHGASLGHPAARDPRREQFGSPTGPDNLLGWPSRIADCLSSMSVCQPSGYESDSGYQEVASGPSFAYAGPRDFPVGATATSSPEAQTGFVTTPARPEPPDYFAHAEPSMPHYMPSYPPLQPTRPAATQPTTAREAMFYPQPVDDAHFSRGGDVGHFHPSDQRAQPQQYGHHTYAEGMMAVPEPPIYGQDARVDGSLASGSGAAAYGEAALISQRGRPMPYMHPAKPELDFAHPNQKQPPAKRGPFKNKDLKEGTALTRKVGSCMRCRIQRIRCDDSEHTACGACSKITAKHPWRLPCLRLKITDIVLGKPGQLKGLEWTRRWKDNGILDSMTEWQWASSEDKVIHVTDVHGIPGHFLELSVRQFVPSEDDRTDRSWVLPNGEKKSVQLPPYAITDIDAAKKACTDFVKQSFNALCEKLVGNQPLLKMTYTAALMRRAQLSVDEGERELLQYTVDLWSSIRLTTTSFQIVGKERLGMPKNLMDETSPLSGKTPLPPVMGAQIDSVLIHDNQNKLRHHALERLNEITLKSKLKSWFTTYLVTFILLHNISLVMKHDASYARKHGLKRRFARVEQVQQYHKGATTLLAYFHYTNKGVFPFSPECKGQHMRTLAELSDDDIQFVRTTGAFAAQNKAEWQRLWDEDDYEHEHYFISQLYEQNWQPRQMKI